MKGEICPQCGFQYTTEIDEDVDLVTPPAWWPKAFAWRPCRVGRIIRHFCTACEWERETWA